MENNVKKFSVEYNPINRSNVFSSGDYISGQITLELAKECKIQSLCVKLKGKAKVLWTENYGKTVVVYQKKEKYFSIEQFVLQGEKGTNVIGQGYHTYPFTFQIPTPQQILVDKKMKLFTLGEITMDVNIPQTGFHQGEGIKVVAYIQNKSSREIKPKYYLYQKNSYFAKGKRKVETKDILKEVGEVIPSHAGHTVTRIITIPPTTCMSILNCNIIKAEYKLRVYLDVKYAADPEVKFNIAILPTLEGSDEEQPPPYNGSEAFMAGESSFLQNPTNYDSSAPPSYMS
ncbi:arrestin domain-containing protein 3-like [Melanotaenia boesemani]|uniref:arrestin domain-containing protein 3-like n=1 Tax=Melanotaenia boesemani TaxID=1250792 RepID=UPI001C04F089|nr:arrestin domain-containing protein 3-like [Melanotaenia boesemani]